MKNRCAARGVMARTLARRDARRAVIGQTSRCFRTPARDPERHRPTPCGWTYNDLIDDARRQDLYTLAAKCVGTAGGEAVEVFRASRLVAWGDEVRRQSICGRVLGSLRRRTVRRLNLAPQEAARYAATSIRKASDEIHASVLALVDELIAMGSRPAAWNLSEAWPADALAPRHRCLAVSPTSQGSG